MSLPVLVDDGGIRPAGPQDACFYCHQTVGNLHAPDCVTIVRDAVYAVWQVTPKGERIRRIGTWTVPEPAAWGADDCEFHRNESSWCANNVRTTGTLAVAAMPKPRPKRCLCSCLAFVLEDRAGEVRRSDD